MRHYTSDDYKASVWEVESGRKILPDLNHGDAVMSAEFSPEGLMILTASLDGSARLWDAYSMQPIELNPVLRHVSRLMQASFAPDGHRIVAAGADGTAYTWDLAGSITIPMALSGVVSDDGTRLLLTNKNTFRILDTASMKSVEPAIQVDSPLLEARLSSNGRFALTVTANYEGPNLLGKLVRVWDCATGACVSSPIALTNRTARVSLSCDGQRLVVVTERGVRLWSTKDGKPVGPVKVHREPVSGAVLSSDGSRLAIFGGNLVSLWDTSSGHEVCAPLRHPLPVSVAEFSLAGHTIVTACKDNQLSQGEARVWDASTGKPIGHPMIHRDGILCAAFSRDGRRVITGGEDFTAVIWDVKTGNPTSAPMRQENQVRGVAFSPNGRWVATAALDGVARVWDAITGEPVTPPLKHPGVLQFVRYSADGYTLITANESGQIWRWDLRPDLRPSEDILLLSQLLSGAQSTASPGPGTLEERRGVWRSLRSAYPDDFAVSQEEVLGWHSRYARVSQTAQHWAAVVFHLSHLAALNPKDSTVLGRLKQSEDHLAEEKSR
ncbi:MAG: hypothetical protein DME21_01705 [Verrucomicrobia bacterium]|nr:MAG: hypothetical protein DME21_01705 [Verrucomicrobiota bacterium]